MTFLHTHCEELSAEQQLEGVRALCRHLDIVPAACRDKPEFGPSFCFTILTGIAKLVFLGSRRGRPPLPAGDFERPVDEGVAAEAARLGGLKGALQLITDAPALDGPWEVGGEAEMGVLFSAQRMARALLSQDQAAAAANVAKWAAKQLRVMGMLKTRLRQHARQNPHCAAQTSLLAVHLARADPAMLSALRTAGMLDMIAKRQAELADSTLPQLGAELEAALQGLKGGPPPQAQQAAHHEEQQAQQAAQHEEQQAQQQVQEPPATEQQQAQQQQAQEQPQPAATQEELLALPVRELKAQLAAAGIDSSGCTEKAELVELLLQQQGASLTGQQQQNGGSTAAGEEAAPAVAAATEAAAAAAAEQVLPKRCAGCGAASGPAGQKLRRCSGCRAVHFCSEQCQRVAWPEHRAACRAAAAQQ